MRGSSNALISVRSARILVCSHTREPQTIHVGRHCDILHVAVMQCLGVRREGSTPPFSLDEETRPTPCLPGLARPNVSSRPSSLYSWLFPYACKRAACARTCLGFLALVLQAPHLPMPMVVYTSALLGRQPFTVQANPSVPRGAAVVDSQVDVEHFVDLFSRGPPPLKRGRRGRRHRIWGEAHGR